MFLGYFLIVSFNDGGFKVYQTDDLGKAIAAAGLARKLGHHAVITRKVPG